MPGIDAPQSCRAVHDLAAVGATIIHAARAREQARRALELPIGSERHPERIECGAVADLDHQTYLSLPPRSAEHTSELQSLMRSSSDVFCLKKKTKTRSNYYSLTRN